MPGTVAERTTEQVTALRAARLERGWSLKQFVELLWAEADRQEVRIGTHPSSVKSLLISWELGRREPRAVYVALLTALYGKSAAELGLKEPKPKISMDSEKLANLFAQYHGFVRCWLYRRVEDFHLADDLASETFIKAAEVVDSVDIENAHRWLAVQARWVLADHYRQQRVKRERLTGVDDKGRVPDWPADDELSRPEETVTGRLSVLDLVDGLTERERELIVLRYFDGLTTTEIEKRTGLTARVIRRALHKALATMRGNAVVAWSLPSTVGELETVA
ncbi:sigma-70 family RNA polymerase sigma factor [Streptomyces alboflavus]|uniref:sigma-70 family RNA polymerase sigma factor n=1 Tax=Streptomyces alboflavus TaxID=67267 RepID=UPI003675AD22